ncbi:MAG: serine/threonine-protein phosphatase [Myxococcales bacterium]|nr:serine/threonine-protein phosphatase [Myxococcales bacterium]MCB9731485.1 serine/threonine-protein phosphatase [Deltaproteobacteria bacterium]
MRKLTWAALTDVGMKRSGNEDAYVVAEEYGLYVVCDGMGGHASGEVASEMTTNEVVNFMRGYFGDGDTSLPYEAEEGTSLDERILSNSIQHANDKVYVSGMKDPKLEGMGTTIVAVKDGGDCLILGHVGDSRIYRYRAGSLEQLTRDHSLLNHKIDMGELKTEEEIKGFKHGNIIVRAIGLKDYVRPETQIVDRQAGDVLILCSDGLSDLVDDWAIENVVEANQDDLEEIATILVRMANDRGGKDNITVLCVRVDDDPAEELDYADDDFHDEVTLPPGTMLPRDEEATDPSRNAFDTRKFRDITTEDDDRTAPHTPVFMWDDVEESQQHQRAQAQHQKAQPRTDESRIRDTVKLGGDDIEDLRRSRGGASARPAAKVPSVIIDDEDLPSIIVDEPAPKKR